MKLEELVPGLRVAGLVPQETVQVIFAQPYGTDTVEVTFKSFSGAISQRVLFRKDEAGLSMTHAGSRPFDGDPADFQIVAEAQRLDLAAFNGPMLAVATSDVRPLPHQIRAVYEDLLPRTPLRFLLADDPGAGKTIMAGLYIKELVLRGDVRRCMVVAPGGLVEQWQDELFAKFGLRFEQFGNHLVEAGYDANVFEAHPLLIARMDQLARNADLLKQLEESQWDLVVVDEAHRMGAHYFGGKLEKTKRFQLGELLGEVARHLLLMTATPHSGKEEDFQLFLTLLDKDRFEGRSRVRVDTSDVMRRMVKEDLLTLEGRRLFPERIAETVPYELTATELDLYDRVTHYVRTGMNRAAKLDDQRRNTVGFALTVLQRRLASSPEAIYKSIQRRSQRLERTKQDMLEGAYRFQGSSVDVEDLEGDEYPAEQRESIETDLVDAATASRTVAELDIERAELVELAEAARRVRDSGTDRKWVELQAILRDNAITVDTRGVPRKLIVFTEHRDTLTYLTARIAALLGDTEAVVAIHGGVARHERRRITEEFTKNPACQVLIATDAAGEGLNLQAAHLVVNYDLPWNPNRIEQRFGRVHRIGQEEVCRLWNLVADNTREGEVFLQLLAKVDEQRKAYGGKVFDVLGGVFDETPLRELLINAIRYGEQPEVRAKMHEVIDRNVGDGIKELLTERALASQHLSEADLSSLRATVESARVRRLRPVDIETAFRNAFGKLGGRMIRREAGRFEIENVPPRVRVGTAGPLATHYHRVAFDVERITPDGLAQADLLGPGHPLYEAVMDEVTNAYGNVLSRGSVLGSSSITKPCVLAGVVEEIVDGTGVQVARRFQYVYVDQHGAVTPAGPAPFLDCPVPAKSMAEAGRALPWLADVESSAVSWIGAHRLPDYLAEVQDRRTADIAKTRRLVEERLCVERDRLLGESRQAAERERTGEKVKESSESLARKAADLRLRLERRLEQLDLQSRLAAKPPQVVVAALLLPVE
jgi:superfamily II DNA or RNA helicase